MYFELTRPKCAEFLSMSTRCQRCTRTDLKSSTCNAVQLPQLLSINISCGDFSSLFSKSLEMKRAFNVHRHNVKNIQALIFSVKRLYCFHGQASKHNDVAFMLHFSWTIKHWSHVTTGTHITTTIFDWLRPHHPPVKNHQIHSIECLIDVLSCSSSRKKYWDDVAWPTEGSSSNAPLNPS